MALRFSVDERLQQPLNAEYIRIRKGAGGKPLSYLESWHVVAQLNEIFGHLGWSSETIDIFEVRTGKVRIRDKELDQAFAAARVRLTVWADVDGKPAGWKVERVGTGCGIATGSGEFETLEQAIKTAESDARKRAAMTLGWSLGLALYDPDQQHVDRSNGDTSVDDSAIIESARALLAKPGLTKAELRDWLRKPASDGRSVQAVLSAADPALYARIIETGRSLPE